MKNVKLKQMPMHKKFYDYCVDMATHVAVGGGQFRACSSKLSRC